MPKRPRLLDWRSGGWVVALALMIVGVLVGWRVLPLIGQSSRAIGDGTDPESYGFDLSSLSVPRTGLAAAGFPRDGLPAMTDPVTMPGSDVAAYNEEHRGKYLVSTDRVIGVELNGEARAYPIRVLNWHEVVNDTLGGVPIAVAYHPLCDSVVVFDRRIGERVVQFGVSGLLHNSNHLLYDRSSEPESPSLWSPLLARAVSGPAAVRGERLRPLPVSLARWATWLEHRPDTDVPRPADDRFKRYGREPYGNYYATGELRYPVVPPPPEGGWPPMDRLAIVLDGKTARVQRLGSASGLSGPPAPPQDDPPLRFDLTVDPPSALVDPDSESRVIFALWFAWHAIRDELLDTAPASEGSAAGAS